MTPAARIACLDLDTFFVSVERLLDPTLVGVPVVVGGRRGDRGVVTSCSYEVRPLGVHSGMSLLEAARLAPEAAFVPTRHDTYGAHAARVKAILEQWCPVVRTASIDEFYLDFAGCERMYSRREDRSDDATIERTVREMRAAIQVETGLPASVGIAAAKAVAKMASGRAKPAGVVMVPAGAERAFAGPLPVRKLPGIGPVAEKVLVAAGIRTLGELVLVADGSGPIAGMAAHLRESLKPSGPLPDRDRPAFREHDEAAEGSLSNERTFFAALGREDLVCDALRSLVERVTWRLRRRGGTARTVTVKIRYDDFSTFTRGRSGPPTNAERDVLALASSLLRGAWDGRRRVRLLGVQLANLSAAPADGEPAQLPLFPPRPRAGVAIDAVRERFGYEAIRLGVASR
ncbi:DNA polymerase IV [Deltaproteobacteria bacterium]|nr:DNA polymerase IV [Deltaproteobacteria bacterium]